MAGILRNSEQYPWVIALPCSGFQGGQIFVQYQQCLAAFMVSGPVGRNQCFHRASSMQHCRGKALDFLLLYFHIGQCWTICQYANLKLGAIQTLSHHGFRLTSLLSDVEMPLWEDTECRMSSCQGTMPVWIISFHSMILLLGSLRSCLHWFGLSLIFGMINYAILDCQCLVQWHCPEAGV